MATVIEMAVTPVVVTTHRDLMPFVSFLDLGADPITWSFIAYIAQMYIGIGLYACIPGAIAVMTGGVFGHMFYRPSRMREWAQPILLGHAEYREGENIAQPRAKAGLISILVGVLYGIGTLAVYYGMRALVSVWPDWLLVVMIILGGTGVLAPGIMASRWTARIVTGAIAGSCEAVVWTLGWLIEQVEIAKK